jgi:Tat protein translocase TatB subunit
VFDLFAPSHLLLIAIAILVFVGPKDIPRFMHMAGRWTRNIQSLAGEFTNGLKELEREAEVAELRKQLLAAQEPQTDMSGARAPTTHSGIAIETETFLVPELAE